MASISVNRSDLFPPTTVVGVYPVGAQNPGNPPTAASITTGTVASDGSLSITNAGISSYTGYVVAAQVGGVWNYARVRSTLDISDTGTAAGTGNTTSGSASLSSVSATQGAFAVGQRITGPGIPAGTFLIGGSGASWTMSAKATATASGVALVAYGASAPVATVGGETRPANTTGWRGKVAQRRAAIGTQVYP